MKRKEKYEEEFNLFEDSAYNNESSSHRHAVKKFFRNIGRRNPKSPFSMMINVAKEPETVLSETINDSYNPVSLFLYSAFFGVLITFLSFGFFLLCEFEGESIINTKNITYVLVHSTTNSIALIIQYFVLNMLFVFSVVKFKYYDELTIKSFIRMFLPAVALRSFVGSIVNMLIRDLYFINRLHISVAMGSVRSALQIDILLIILTCLMDIWLARYVTKILTTKYEFDKKYTKPAFIIVSVGCIAITLLFYYLMYFKFLS